MSVPSDPLTLGIVLISGSHERAHYAFMLAAGAASLGRKVVLFATNAGCHALLRDWSGLTDPGRDAQAQSRGVASLDTLREAAADLAVRHIACEAGLRMIAADADALLPNIEVAGIASFLEAVGAGQIVTF